MYMLRIRDTAGWDQYVDGYYSDDLEVIRRRMFALAALLQPHIEVWVLNRETLQDYGYAQGEAEA